MPEHQIISHKTKYEINVDQVQAQYDISMLVGDQDIKV